MYYGSERSKQKLAQATADLPKINAACAAVFPELTLRTSDGLKSEYAATHSAFTGKINDIEVKIEFGPRTTERFDFNYDIFQADIRVGSGNTKVYPQKKDGTFSWDKIKAFVAQEIEDAKAKQAQREVADKRRDFNNAILADTPLKHLQPDTWSATKEGEIIVSFREQLTFDQAKKLDKFISELLASN